MESIAKQVKDEQLIYLLGAPPFQLTEYEVRVLSTLAMGERSPSEIWHNAAIPRTKTYDVLNSLVQKGLVTKTNEKPLAFGLKIDAIRSMQEGVDEIHRKVSSFLNQIHETYRGELSRSVTARIDELLQKMGFIVSYSEDEVKCLYVISPRGVKMLVVFVPHQGDVSLYWRYANEARSKGRVQALLFVGSKPVLHQLASISGDEFSGVEYDPVNLSKTLSEYVEEQEELESIATEKEQAYDAVAQRIHSLASQCQEKMERELLSVNEDSKGVNLVGQRLHALLDLRYDADLRWRALPRRFVRRGFYDKDGVYQMDSLLQYCNILERSLLNLLGEINGLISISYFSKDWNLEKEESLEDYRKAINQQSFRKDMQNFINSSLGISKITTAAIIGDAGTGKSFFQRYYVDRLNVEDVKCIAVYTKTESRFVELHKNLVVEIGSKLITNRKILDHDFFRYQKTYSGMVKTFREVISELAKIHGYSRVFWFIDDEEEILPKETSLMLELRGLMLALQEEPISVIISFSPGTYESISRKEGVILTGSLEPKSVCRLSAFTRDDIAEIVGKSFHPPLLSETNVKWLTDILLQVTKGNPKRVVNMMEQIVAASTQKGSEIDKEFVMRLLETEEAQ